MNVYFYPYGSNNHGYYVQDTNFTKVIPVRNAKKFALENCDLRHPLLTKSEFYDCLSTDIKGLKRKEFDICGNTGMFIFRS